MECVCQRTPHILVADDLLYLDKGVVGAYEEGVDTPIRGFSNKYYDPNSYISLYAGVKNGTVETAAITLNNSERVELKLSTAESGVSQRIDLNIFGTKFPSYMYPVFSNPLKYTAYGDLTPEINVTVGDGSSDDVVEVGGLDIMNTHLPVTNLTINQPYRSSSERNGDSLYLLNELTPDHYKINLDQTQYQITQSEGELFNIPHFAWKCTKISSVEPAETPKNAISADGKYAVGNLLIFEDAGVTYITLDTDGNGIVSDEEKTAKVSVADSLEIAGNSKVTMLSGTVKTMYMKNCVYAPGDFDATCGKNGGTQLLLKGGEVRALNIYTGAEKSTVQQDELSTLRSVDIEKAGVSSVEVTLNGKLDETYDGMSEIRYESEAAGTITLGANANIVDGTSCQFYRLSKTGSGMTVDLSAYVPHELIEGGGNYYKDINVSTWRDGATGIAEGITPPKGYDFNTGMWESGQYRFYLQSGEAGTTAYNLNLGTVDYGYETKTATPIPTECLPADTTNMEAVNASSEWYIFDKTAKTIAPKDNVPAGVHTVKLVMDSTGKLSKDVIFVTFTVERLALDVHVKALVTKTLHQVGDTAYKQGYTLTKTVGGAAFEQSKLGADMDLLCFYGEETLGDHALFLNKSDSDNFIFTLKTPGNVKILSPVIDPASEFGKAQAVISSLDSGDKTQADWSKVGVKLAAPQNYLICASSQGPFNPSLTIKDSSVEPQTVTYYLRDNNPDSATFGIIDPTPRTATVRVCRDLPINGNPLIQMGEITTVTAEITLISTPNSYTGEFCDLRGMYLMTCTHTAASAYDETRLVNKLWIPKPAADYTFHGTLTGLTASTNYDVFVIYANEAGYMTDPVFLSTFSSAQPRLTGSVVIDNTAPIIGDTLTATPNVLMPDYDYGTVMYEWFAGSDSLGAMSAANNSYTITASDFGKVIRVKITSSRTSGELESSATAAVDKQPGPAAPEGGIVDDRLGIDSFTFTSILGVTYEYKVGDGEWTSLVATGTTTDIVIGNISLAAGGVQVRVKETPIRKAGDSLSSTDAFTYSLTGTTTLSGGKQYGDTLSVQTPSVPSGAVFHYAWTAEGRSVGGDIASYSISKNDVGKNIQVTITAEGYDGSVVSNSVTATTRALTVLADHLTKAYGQKDPDLTWQTPQIDQLMSGDILTEALERVEGETVGDWPINQGTLTAGPAYAIQFTENNLTIEPAAVNLQISLSPASQKVNKHVDITVIAKNGESNLMDSGWEQPTGITLTGPDQTPIDLQSTGNGVYTARYTVPADTAAGTILHFSAGVNDQTKNYAPISPANATLTVTDRNAVKVTVTADRSEGVVYGDSVTYNAEVKKANALLDLLDTLDGTITFYLGDPEEGADPIATKTIGTDALSITLDKKTLTAGNHTVYAMYSGNLDFSTGIANTNTVVAPKALSWDTTDLSAIKTEDGNTNADILGTLRVKGELVAGESNFTYTDLSGEYNGAAPGSHIVTATVNGAKVNSNYTLPSGKLTITGTIFAVNILPNPPAGTDDILYRLEQIIGLPFVPDALKSNPQLNTVEQIATAMRLQIQQLLPGVTEKQFHLYDITLQYSIDQGNNWLTATSLPAGGVSILLRYPAGTNMRHFDFLISHMITSGSQAGTIELIVPKETPQGLQFILSSMSPVAVGYQNTSSAEDESTDVPETSKPTNPSTGDSSHPWLYLTMLGLSAAALGGSFLVRKKRKA